MLRHYLTVAIRDTTRQPFTTAVSVLTLSLGLVCMPPGHLGWGEPRIPFPTRIAGCRIRVPNESSPLPARRGRTCDGFIT